jgi:hypothetical protein
VGGGALVPLESPDSITGLTSLDDILCIGSLGDMTLVTVLSLYQVGKTTKHNDNLTLVHTTTMISL